MFLVNECICYSHKNCFDYIFILRKAGSIIATGTKAHEKAGEDQREMMSRWDSWKMALLIEFYYDKREKIKRGDGL